MKAFLAKELEKDITASKKSLWYSLGIFGYSLSSVILLLVVTRFLGQNEGGVFSIGWAVCQQMCTVGLFGTRNYQVSDIDGHYEDKYYFSSKLVTILMMLAGTFIYTFMLQLSIDKTIIAFLLTVLMTIEVWADVSAGFLQKKDRLDLVGKSYLGRVIGYDIVFVLLIVSLKSMSFAIMGAIVFSALWLLLFDFPLIRMVGVKQLPIHLKKMLQLLFDCMPIFMSAFLTNYIVNIPKNSIELYLTDSLQSIYNIIFMPSAIITLFMSFVLVPMYTKISATWQKRDYKGFLGIISRITGLVVGLTVVIAIGGFLIGVPVLGFIYNVDLTPYKFDFVMLIFAGGINSFATFLVYILTVLRSQKYLLGIYGVVAVIGSFISNGMVRNQGLIGAAQLYFTLVSLIAVLLVVVTFISYRIRKKDHVLL